MGDDTWATIKKNATERHLKVSIRALRNSEYRSGNAAAIGGGQQMNIMKLNPGELIPMAETLDFYEDIMDMFEVLGLKVTYLSVDEQLPDDTMGNV